MTIQMSNESLQSLFLSRQGITEEAFMKTEKLIQMVSEGTNIFKDGKFIKTDCDGLITEKKTEIPKSVIICAEWVFDKKGVKGDIAKCSNIFGFFDKLELNQDIIKIPVYTASKENVRYYECELIENNDVINFDIKKDLPYFLVSVGAEYIESYIMIDDIGGGVYLEYHNTPHFHSPANDKSYGFIVIGKLINNNIELTGFKIPFGFGLYMPPYVIHNDCFLVGGWNVIYTIADKFSTALLMHNNKLVSFEFV